MKGGGSGLLLVHLHGRAKHRLLDRLRQGKVASSGCEAPTNQRSSNNATQSKAKVQKIFEMRLN